MGLIIQDQLKRALVKTKDYIDKKIEETSEICYLNDYGFPSFRQLKSYADDGQHSYTADGSYFGILLNIVVTKRDIIYALNYNKYGVIYATSAYSQDRHLMFFRFIEDNCEYVFMITPENNNISIERHQQEIQTFINISYEELVTLRDDNLLTPGVQYRIIDYVTTTTQENTKSAGHQFDIIVTADSTNTLNEEARACLHEGDTYFSNAGAKLEAWKIWYSLDNDTDRFSWAGNKKLPTIEFLGTYSFEEPVSSVVFCDVKHTLKLGISALVCSGPPIEVTLVDEYTIKVESVSPDIGSYIQGLGGIEVYSEGKGVIYRMIDEWNNDIPYDFKNIIFVDMKKFTIKAEAYYYSSWWSGMLIRDNSLDKSDGSLLFYAWILTNVTGPTSNEVWYTINDYIESIDTVFYKYGDVGFQVSETIRITDIAQGQAQYTFGNTLSVDKELNEFVDYSIYKKNCYNNIIKPLFSETNCLELNVILFGEECYNNSFGNDCCFNSFGNKCYFNYFGNKCCNNSFGYYCYDNTFGDNCDNNYFKNNCSKNSFGKGCNNNSFEEFCINNSFAPSCFNNSFKNNCMSNSFGSGCSENSLGKYCMDNSFGDNCDTNYFKNECCYNSFGNHCDCNSYRASSSTSSSLVDSFYYNHFDDGCSYNVIWSSNTTSGSTKLQNINIVRGVSGTDSNYNYIDITELEAQHEIKVAKNSKGEIKIYCEADLIA